MKTPKKPVKKSSSPTPRWKRIAQILDKELTVAKDRIEDLDAQLAEARKPKDTTYNGWSNYETWWMALIFDNESGLQARFADEADNLVHGIDHIDDFKASMTSHLAVIMEDWLGEFVDESGGHALMKDMCNTFIQDVDFEEIARHYIDDAIENNK